MLHGGDMITVLYVSRRRQPPTALPVLAMFFSRGMAAICQTRLGRLECPDTGGPIGYPAIRQHAC